MTTLSTREPRSERYQVLLVDDHPIVRGGLAQLIGQEPDLMVCGEAESAQEAMQAVIALQPDLAVVDLTLKDSSGFDLITNLQNHVPTLPILVMSMHAEPLYAERVIRAGAKGYIVKEEARDTVITAIRQVLRGEIYVSQHMVTTLLQSLGKNSAEVGADPLTRLSPRELEVFHFIAQGYTTRQIAETMQRSVKTVEAHRAHIMEKLHFDSAADLTRYALQRL